MAETQSRKDELAMEIYRQIKDPDKKEQFRQFARANGTVIPTMKTTEELGPLDYLLGVGELAGSIATGALAEPISGFAGMAGGIIPGKPGQAERYVKGTQETLTYAPKSKGGFAVARKAGELMEPISEGVEIAKGAIGGAGEKIAGPLGASGAITAVAAIPMVLGLKGTKQAKKMALGRMIPKIKNIGALYDELGNLLPAIKKGIKEAGLSFEDLEGIIPEKLTPDFESTVKKIKKAESAVLMPEKKYGKLIEEISPSQDVMAATEKLGIQTPPIPSIVSENPTYRAIEQGLKSIPGSQLATQEKAFISELAKKADDLITEFGGEIDKSKLSEDFRSRSKAVVTELEQAAGDAYKKVDEIIPKAVEIKANDTLQIINKMADDLGGAEYLPPRVRGLLKNLSPESKPTYARLDMVRKQIGQAMRKGSGPFKDADEGLLKRLYGSLQKDQKAVAEQFNAKDLYENASNLVAQRKNIEDQMVKTMGKDIQGAITQKGKQAILNLQNGNTKEFDSLMANIPKEIGPEIKKSVAITALNDAFTQGSRMERSLNIPGFDDFMVGIKRNKIAYNRLKNNIGIDAMDRLETMHKVAGAVRRAQKNAITTGRIVAVPGMFDESSNIAKRVYGTAERAVSAVPGMKTMGAIADTIKAKKTPRSTAADQFLSSPKFLNILSQKAAGNIDTINKVERAEKIIERLKTYQKWKKTLSQKDLTDLSSIGILGYLTGETLKPTEEKENE